MGFTYCVVVDGPEQVLERLFKVVGREDVDNGLIGK